MPVARSTTANLFVMGLAVLLSIGSAMAQVRRPPMSDADRDRQHRLLVEQGERASRATPPSPDPAVAPNNGIEQIPIDTGRSSGSFKEDGKQPDAENVQLASAPHVPIRQE